MIKHPLEILKVETWNEFLSQSDRVGIRIKSPRKIPLNAIECEPVPTRVLNPNASEASYKLKQRSYRKTKLQFFFRGDFIREPSAIYGNIWIWLIAILSVTYIVYAHNRSFRYCYDRDKCVVYQYVDIQFKFFLKIGNCWKGLKCFQTYEIPKMNSRFHNAKSPSYLYLFIIRYASMINRHMTWICAWTLIKGINDNN